MDDFDVLCQYSQLDTEEKIFQLVVWLNTKQGTSLALYRFTNLLDALYNGVVFVMVGDSI